MTSAAAGPSRTEVFELKSKCAQLGRDYVKDTVDLKSGFHYYRFRYDVPYNRCLAEVTTVTPEGAHQRNVADAQEYVDLASCHETKPGNGAVICHVFENPASKNEAKELMDKLMNEHSDWP